ncbi:MAG: hypothetical protein GXP29_14995 [Planctomycetes bacterium]|nr:hypothetical protein [Planctomycetota bacterium]
MNVATAKVTESTRKIASRDDPCARIETAPDGFVARFSVTPSADLPHRCFAVFDRYRVAPRSLSIFLDRQNQAKLAITLKTQPCCKSDLIGAVDELIRADGG